MPDEDVIAKASTKRPRTLNPVTFYDRDELPAREKDFRAKPVKVRPTVPPMVDEELEPEYLEHEPEAADQPMVLALSVEPGTVTVETMEPPKPTAPSKPPAARTHPSNLPAKD